MDEYDLGVGCVRPSIPTLRGRGARDETKYQLGKYQEQEYREEFMLKRGKSVKGMKVLRAVSIFLTY